VPCTLMSMMSNVLMKPRSLDVSITSNRAGKSLAARLAAPLRQPGFVTPPN
jgi:hypothetical protein